MRWDQRIGRRLKLRDLNILLVLADAGSMAKAAAALAISQPAVSRAIADMEHTLGVTLFDRTPQGVALTQYGRALLKRSVAVFDELKQGVDDIGFLAAPGAGELRVACSPALAEGVVLATIDRLSQLHPRAVFHVEDVGTLYEKLRDRQVEIGLARTPEQVPEDIALEPLFDEPMIVVASELNPLTRRRKLKLADLLHERWTWPPPGSVFDSIVVAAFRAYGLEPPRTTVYAQAINMRIALAATGRFLAIVPASIMKFPTRHPSIRTLPVDIPIARPQFGITTLKNRTLGPLAQLFIETAREVVKPLRRDRLSQNRGRRVSPLRGTPA